MIGAVRAYTGVSRSLAPNHLFAGVFSTLGTAGRLARGGPPRLSDRATAVRNRQRYKRDSAVWNGFERSGKVVKTIGPREAGGLRRGPDCQTGYFGEGVGL